MIVVACSDDTIKVDIPQQELRAMLPERLRQADIWFRVEDETKYVFKQKDSDRVVEIARQIRAERIPVGRSSNFGPEMKAIMLRKLKENNVPHELRKFGDEEWVVWEEQYHPVVERLHAEAEQELLAEINRMVEEHNKKMLEKLESERNNSPD